MTSASVLSALGVAVLVVLLLLALATGIGLLAWAIGWFWNAARREWADR